MLIDAAILSGFHRLDARIRKHPASVLVPINGPVICLAY